MAVVMLAALCAGCAGSNTAAWNGRRGYDGNGDYGYDVAASRSEAQSYAVRAARAYPVPGTPDDPWGPYIHEAASRFSVPERWIRAVMRQESGGHADGPDGLPITSSAGAMGLMQVMPRTYDILRGHYGLGGDPYEPRDNILAGTAYIREMYDIYGAPGFLAAYNAGPQRLDSYLAGGDPLPDETVNYLASIAPRLGTEVAMTGPLAVYAGSGVGGGVLLARMPAPVSGGAAFDDADRAFDGGGLVTASAPTGVLTGTQPAYATARPALVSANFTAAPAPLAIGASAPLPPTGEGGNWAIQVGAFPDRNTSAEFIALARSRAGALLADARPAITTVDRGTVLYRARLVGLSFDRATASCNRLAAEGVDCFPVPPGS